MKTISCTFLCWPFAKLKVLASGWLHMMKGVLAAHGFRTARIQDHDCAIITLMWSFLNVFKAHEKPYGLVGVLHCRQSPPHRPHQPHAQLMSLAGPCPSSLAADVSSFSSYPLTASPPRLLLL